MKRIDGLAGGLWAGAALILLFGAVGWLWRPEVVHGLLQREPEQVRARRNLQRAEKLAQLAPDYLDACRAAGL